MASSLVMPLDSQGGGGLLGRGRSRASCRWITRALFAGSFGVISSLAVPGVSSLATLREVILTAAASPASLVVPGVSSLAVPGVSSLALPEVSSLATLHEGQKGLDHCLKALKETSWISKVLLLATAAWGLQVHQVVPW